MKSWKGNIRIRKQPDGRYYASIKREGTFATGATRDEARDKLIERRERLKSQCHPDTVVNSASDQGAGYRPKANPRTVINQARNEAFRGRRE